MTATRCLSLVSHWIRRRVLTVTILALALSTAQPWVLAAEVGADQAAATGTHIRGDLDSAYPVTIFTREMIEVSGASTLQEFIQKLPQNFNGGASETTISSVTGGGNAVDLVNGTGVNLRGLGNDSTLVLISGHRVAPGNTSGNFVDLSLIPLTAVERVEIVTDGASAVYGADAVGGVVNIIIGRNLEGAETRVRYGGAESSSSHETTVGQSLGHSWDNGSALLMYEYWDRTPLRASDRSQSSSAPQPFMLLPEQVRHSAVFSVDHSPADGLEVLADGMYAHRTTYLDTTAQGFSYRGLATIDAYSASLSTRMDLPRGSQMEITAAYSANKTDHEAVAGGGIGRFADDKVKSDILSVDAKWDGTAISLPSGDVRFAVGAQFRREEFEDSGIGMTDFRPARNVSAAFLELRLPLLGTSRALSGANRLDLTLADRDEHYSVFGQSNNPQVGLIFRPLKEVKLRGTYGTAFRAPLLSDLNPVPIQAVALPEFDPLSNLPANTLVEFGGNPTLRAEKARTWTLGADFTSESVPVHASVTYYNIRFSDLIEDPEFSVDITQALSVENILGPAIVQRNPPATQVQQLASTPGYSNPLGIDLNSVGAIVDSRVQNLSIVRTRGLDLDGSWDVKGPFGGNVEFGVTATYIFDFDSEFTARAASVSIRNTPYNPVDLKLRARALLRVGGLVIGSFVNYVNAYTDPDTGPIGSWTTVDMTATYLFSARHGPLVNMSVGAVGTNIGGRRPPSVPNPYAINFDGANANAVGRMLSLRVAKGW